MLEERGAGEGSGLSGDSLLVDGTQGSEKGGGGGGGEGEVGPNGSVTYCVLPMHPGDVCYWVSVNRCILGNIRQTRGFHHQFFLTPPLDDYYCYFFKVLLCKNKSIYSTYS